MLTYNYFKTKPLSSFRVRPFVPTTKEIDANVVLDRDEKKLDVYLGLHKGSLIVSTLYVFLPFTISLDPQLRKDITGKIFSILVPLVDLFLSRHTIDNSFHFRTISTDRADIQNEPTYSKYCNCKFSSPYCSKSINATSVY